MSDAPAAFTLFDTALGRCGIAWRPASAGSDAAVVAFSLPDADDEATAARFRRMVDAAPSVADTFIADVIARVQRLLAGEPIDLAAIPVDLGDVPPFEAAVYAALREVGPGETVTYGELATRAGSNPGAARAVGVAMARNPAPVIVPCHRVLAGGGKSGGFSAPGSVGTKFRLLQIERARRGGEDLLFADLPLAVGPGSSA